MEQDGHLAFKDTVATAESLGILDITYLCLWVWLQVLLNFLQGGSMPGSYTSHPQARWHGFVHVIIVCVCRVSRETGEARDERIKKALLEGMIRNM